MSEQPVELSILAAPPDLRFLAPTIDHQLRAFAGAQCVGHRALVIDDRTERFGVEPVETLRRLGDSLVRSGRIDEVRSIDWSPTAVADSMGRWYDGPRATDAGGRAVYQYVFSLESSRCHLVLHLDSDVMFHGDLAGWLDSTVGVFDAEIATAAIVPNAAVPRASRPAEWVFGRRRHRRRWPLGWDVGRDVTTRAVLLHRERIIKTLPLACADAGEQWERSLSVALEAQGLEVRRWIDDGYWMIHPHRHNAMHARFVRTLIAEIEAGRYPYRRFGHPWDITTEGWRFAPWLPRLWWRSARR